LLLEVMGEAANTPENSTGMGPESPSAAERFMPKLYDELRALAAHHMRRERRGHTLQTTALVNEAYLKLFEREGLAAESREHFLALAACTMRGILVDHARKHVARGGRMPRVALADIDPEAAREETDFLALDTALEKLTKINPRGSRIVELRFFGGLSVDEAAQELGLSPRTVDAEWRAARDWLAAEFERGSAL
jgi:RNA polymerase sigma factor (TIGR02999 family)